MIRVHVFTSAAANYLPKVRVLFQSLRRLRPDWRLHLVVADAPPPREALDGVPLDELHLIEDLGIPEWRAWTFSHSLVELATAIKPFALKRLLARDDCDAAIYLDPDIVAFSPLDELVAAFDAADILLTPHQTVPEPTLHGVMANEICTLQHGIYNLGFIGVAARAEGLAFADWWARRAYSFCREDIPSGLYTDQRWIDLVPAFFERFRILRAPGLNAGPWNLSTRRLEGQAPDALTVDGQPLGFFHFSAVDIPGTFAGPKVDPTVAALAEWYRAQTAPSPAEQGLDWAFAAFTDGAPILREHRVVYRLRGDLQRAFPDPFRSGPAGFQAWWAVHAAAEYPGLFQPGVHQATLAHLNSALRAGYVEL
jgi:hypothetical protein